MDIEYTKDCRISINRMAGEDNWCITIGSITTYGISFDECVDMIKIALKNSS